MATSQKALANLSQKMAAFILVIVIICHRSLCLDIEMMKNHKLWSLLQSTRSLSQMNPWTDLYESYPILKESVIKKRQRNDPMSFVSDRSSKIPPKFDVTDDRLSYDFESQPQEFRPAEEIPNPRNFPGNFPPITFAHNQEDPTGFSPFLNPSPPCANRKTSTLETLWQDISDLRQQGHSRKALLTTTLAAIYRDLGTKRRVSSRPSLPPTHDTPYKEQRKKLRHLWESHDTQPAVPPRGYNEDAYYMDPGFPVAIKPPVEGVEVVVKTSSDSTNDYRQLVTISPAMSVHGAIYQASLQFDENFGFKNPLAFHLGLLEEENCHIIAENSGKSADKEHYWMIRVYDDLKLKYNSPCIPPRDKMVLRPGNRIEITFVKLRKPEIKETSDIGISGS